MVHVRVSVSASGALSELRMTGHVSPAQGARGSNTVCAAVTGLVRSCAEAIAAHSAIEANGSAEAEGEFRLSVAGVAPGHDDWLRGVTDVLLNGLRRMSADTPAEVELEER